MARYGRTLTRRKGEADAPSGATMRVGHKFQVEASILHCVFFGIWRPVFEFLRMRKRHMPILWEL